MEKNTKEIKNNLEADSKKEDMNKDSEVNKASPRLPKGFFWLIAGLILLVSGGLVYKNINQLNAPKTKTVMVTKQIVVKRSKDLGLIYRALTGKAIDVNTGKIVTAARLFSLNDKNIYLELDLNTPPKGTVIDYIRYKNGKYVDHGEVTITTGTTKNLLFNWSISNLLANLTEGKWKVATYTNGVLAKRVLYEVKNNRVSRVYEDSSISSNDSDYSLSKSFALSTNH
jgi:hypothetical protein